jgi:hypothetical protein
LAASEGLQAMAFWGVVSSIIVFVVGGGFVCLTWQVARTRRAAARVDEA